MRSLSALQNKQRTAVLEWLVFILIITAYYVWFSTSTVYAVSANGRLLDVFNSDEYSHFNIIREALNEHTLCVNWAIYGHFYFNLVLIPLYILQRFMPISDHVIILFLRYATTIAGAFTVLLTFGLARRYFSRPTAWVSALLLMVLPSTFNYWSVTSHPDTVQMLAIVGSVFACCEYIYSNKKHWLFVATVCAGLAFSTKYAGVFLMPVIWLLCLVPFNELGKGFNLNFLSKDKLRASIPLIFITGVLFLLTFVVSSPCSFAGGQFVDGIELQSRITKSGYVFKTDNNHLEWFSILGSSYLLGEINLILLSVALIPFFVKIWNTQGNEFFSPKGLLWLWVLFYFMYAFFFVNLRLDRYMLTILPFMFILLVDFWREVLISLKARYTSNIAYYLVLVAIIVYCGIEIRDGFLRQRDFIATVTTSEDNNAVIEAGNWLEINYKPSTYILYDKYSYVPPAFKHVRASYGLTEDILKIFNPRVVVINGSIRDLYRNAADADKFADGPERFMASYNFYKLMEEEKLGYILVKDFGGLWVYEKQR